MTEDNTSWPRACELCSELKGVKSKLFKNSRALNTHIRRRHSNPLAVTQNAKEKKREYQRQWRANRTKQSSVPLIEESREESNLVQPHFCPACGCRFLILSPEANIEAIRLAIEASKGG